ncbi:hypothetical protein IWQ61_002927 [Dispira simplex]|nr:hypothetical protein IWQ61_002927 [Dispira simplex]
MLGLTSTYAACAWCITVLLCHCMTTTYAWSRIPQHTATHHKPVSTGYRLATRDTEPNYLRRREDDVSKSSNLKVLSLMSDSFPDPGSDVIDCGTFTAAVKAAGYPAPKPGHCDIFRNSIKSRGDITDAREAAMFLTQVLWESDGLRHTTEHGCEDNKCAGKYASELDYRSSSDGEKNGTVNQYYGRGYIQLTWASNYLDASKALFGNDLLLKEPLLVSSNDTIAWDTSFWYWKNRVHKEPGVTDGEFGASTKAINGELECGGPNQEKAHKRFELYQKVLKVIAPKEKPNPAGCYEVDSD